MYHIEIGQDIQLIKDILYVSTDNRKTWIPLHKFSYVSHHSPFLWNMNMLNKLHELRPNSAYLKRS